MIIDDTNYRKGYKAMAAVLLLYYHLLSDGGITNDQIVYVDLDDFDGFSYLNVVVDERWSPDINERLLREGAVIYLLCWFDDMLSDYSEGALYHPVAQKIISEFHAGNLSCIPEVKQLMHLFVDVPEEKWDFEAYGEALSNIYQKYVVGTFIRMLDQHQS